MAPFAPDPDGSRLLTGATAGELLESMVGAAGGRLDGWRLHHLDVLPDEETTATFAVDVTWPHGRTRELLCATVRASGPSDADAGAAIFRTGLLRQHEVAAWWYPADPDVPGLAVVSRPERLAHLLHDSGVLARRPDPGSLAVSVLSYRPRRRCVVRVDAGGHRCYVKALRPGADTDVRHRLDLLHGAGMPAAPVLGNDPGHALVVLGELPGRPLGDVLFEADPGRAEQLVALLDALPAGVAALPRRRPWADAIAHYAEVVGHVVPEEQGRLARLVGVLEPAITGAAPGDEPTHGDFHEQQVHVAPDAAGATHVVGLLDVDTLGPGRRVDDLACLLAHLVSIQGMDPVQTARRDAVLAAWLPVLDARVDAAELRLRAAAVVVSLATGPSRAQEDGWRRRTSALLDAAEALVRQAR